MTYDEAVSVLCTKDTPPSDEGLEMVLDIDCRGTDFLLLGYEALRDWPVLDEEPADGGEVYEEVPEPMFEVIGEVIYDADDDHLAF